MAGDNLIKILTRLPNDVRPSLGKPYAKLFWCCVWGLNDILLFKNRYLYDFDLSAECCSIVWNCDENKSKSYKSYYIMYSHIDFMQYWKKIITTVKATYTYCLVTVTSIKLKKKIVIKVLSSTFQSIYRITGQPLQSHKIKHKLWSNSTTKPVWQNCIHHHHTYTCEPIFLPESRSN